MWIADYQPCLKNNVGVSPKISSMLLKKGSVYSIGRQASNDICVDHPKVSRSQVKLKVNADGKMEISNIGHASLTCGKRILDGKQESPYIINTSTIVKIKVANDWKIVLRNMEDITVSKYIYQKISSILSLDFSNELKDNEIIIGNSKELIENMELWIDTLLDQEWEKCGGLSKIIIPKTTKDFKVGEKKESQTDKMIEVMPMSPDSQYSLMNRSSKRTRKSQLQSVFDEFENLDDSSLVNSTTSTPKYTYASQNTFRLKKSQLTQFFDDMDESEPILNSNGKQKENLDFKKAHIENEVKDPEKSKELDMENVGETMSNLSIKRPIEVSPGFPAKKLKSSHPKEALVDVFKKTKQIKIDRMEKEKELINSIKANNEVAKVTKFKVIRKAVNPHVYSGHKIIYNNDPKWENRLNYSKFSKINNTSQYNPILDSTIKTVKFKSSSYKSNERQINLFQNEYMIPELDTMFETRPRQSQIITRNIEFENRKREPTLFVDSDYEDTQYNTKESSGYPSLRTSEISNFHTKIGSMPDTTARATQLPTHTLEDDETPIFRSRRR